MTGLAPGASVVALVLTPLVAAVIGLVAALAALRIDARRSASDALIRKRLALYDEIAPRIDDLDCAMRAVGDWRAVPPPEAVARKRELDRLVHVYGALFPPAVTARYRRFRDLCFVTHTGHGRAARLRAEPARLRRNWGTDWNGDWDRCLADPPSPSDEAVADAARALIETLALAIGAGSGAAARSSGVAADTLGSRDGRAHDPRTDPWL